MRDSVHGFRQVVASLRRRNVTCSSGGMMSSFMSLGPLGALFKFVRRMVIGLEGLKGVQVSRACATALGDFYHFERRGSITLSGISSSVVVTCRTCLGADKIDLGDSSFCVQGLQTICGHTIRGRLAPRQFPFGRICAKVNGAIGQTIPVGIVGRVGRVSLSCDSSLSFTESVFLFSFCAHKVSLISVTCLEGGSLTGNVLSCHHHGAKRRLFVG